MKRENALGILYFAVHFILEASCFYVLTSYIGSRYVWALMLLYDFIAFVPQGFFGFLRDKGIKINFAFIGTVLTSLALLLMWTQQNAFLVIAVISVGNCLVHIHAAEMTLRSSKGRITPCAVFVSGGSFGLITGKLMSSYHIAVPAVLALNLISLIPILIAEKLKQDGQDNLSQYNFASTKFKPALIISLAVFIVAVRAYMGYGIPTSWNKTELQAVLMYCALGIGKAAGGVLTDKIGIRKTAVISTLGALPFLIAGDTLMSVSLIGIMMFSMTMAVTLALIVSVLQKYPGVAFGMTTIGLFLGTVPMFFFRIHSFVINAVIITVLTVLSVILLIMICAKKSEKERLK